MKVVRMQYCMDDGTIEHIVPRQLHCHSSLLDGIDDFKVEDGEEERFADARIGKWGDFVKTLTRRDMSSSLEDARTCFLLPTDRMCILKRLRLSLTSYHM